MIPKRLIDISLAKEKLQWYPKTSLNEGLIKTVKWYHERFKNFNPEKLS